MSRTVLEPDAGVPLIDLLLTSKVADLNLEAPSGHGLGYIAASALVKQLPEMHSIRRLNLRTHSEAEKEMFFALQRNKTILHVQYGYPFFRPWTPELHSLFSDHTHRALFCTLLSAGRLPLQLPNEMWLIVFSHMPVPGIGRTAIAQREVRGEDYGRRGV